MTTCELGCTSHGNPEVTTEDLCYEAGLSDAATEIMTGKSVYTGPPGVLTMDEAFAYFDGRTWAFNHREEVAL